MLAFREGKRFISTASWKLGIIKMAFGPHEGDQQWVRDWIRRHGVSTLRPRQNGCLFPDDIFKSIFLNENARLSTKFVLKGPIDNIPALVQIMARRRPGDQPLSEPMMVNLTTHICVTRPQWVNAMRPRQNGCLFPDDISKSIFMNLKCTNFDWDFTKFVLKGPVNTIPALVQIMARHRPGDEPLSEPMMVSLLTRICVNRLQYLSMRWWSLDNLGIALNLLNKSIGRTCHFSLIHISRRLYHVSGKTRFNGKILFSRNSNAVAATHICGNVYWHASWFTKACNNYTDWPIIISHSIWMADFKNFYTSSYTPWLHPK